ncbi:hypothetical protein C5467_08980 [Photorhabdus khanii subsp. guanajuatensis]|uniref:Uncharacterized protein n=1 Tax=Photorhabdus khanii subsp. guanajuatensis TaxID=2100166 RepID=A0A4V2X8C2_9GAMM|nr:hypothetical protein C5467_08980 [Photorhabdus khanii subsp. guanajuatensis]
MLESGGKAGDVISLRQLQLFQFPRNGITSSTQLLISRYFDVDIKNFAPGINHGLPVIVNMFPLPICVRNPSVCKG